MNNILITHLITAFVLLAVSFIMKLWPPRKINHFYGYRSPQSMKNQHNWDLANRYSADLLMWAGTSNVVIHLLSYLTIGGEVSLFIPLAYFIAFIFVSMILVEKRLRQSGI